MSAIYPLHFRWDGEAMHPLNPRAADRQYVVGETYRLDHVEERSAKSHDHYFASVDEIWHNLPDELAQRFPTSEHLRKWALIRTGWCDQRSHVMPSHKAALDLVPLLRSLDEYAEVAVSGATVVMLTAKSQSMKAQGKADFQRSKDDVLGCLASMLGVTPDQLRQSAAA